MAVSCVQIYRLVSRAPCTTQRSPYRMDVRMGSSGKFFVGGNWKANGTKESVSKLVSGLNSAQFPSEVDVIVALHHSPAYVVENIDSRIKSAHRIVG